MKKRLSVTELYLRLTILPAVAVFLAVSLLQILTFMAPQWSAGFDPEFGGVFEHQISRWTPFLGRLGIPALALVLALCCSSGKRSDFYMTLSRLGISRAEQQLLAAGLFTGYFLLYWALQFLTVTLLYSLSELRGGSDPMWYFLACYRSEYLHSLMPLRDGWAYVRNIMLAAAFGSLSSLACSAGTQWQYLMLPLSCSALSMFIPLEHSATATPSILTSILLLAVTVLCIFKMRRRDQDEKI